jgi:hypothetical protein
LKTSVSVAKLRTGSRDTRMTTANKAAVILLKTNKFFMFVLPSDKF